MSDADIDTVTAADVTGLNRAVVARAADLARLVGTGLLIVAGLGVLAWAWLVLRGLDVIGDQYFGEDLAFNERVDLVAGYVSLLLFSGLAAGVGVGLRLGADVSVARTGGSLTGVEAGEPLASLRRRPPVGDAGDGDEAPA
jgi:hypothetical protein